MLVQLAGCLSVLHAGQTLVAPDDMKHAGPVRSATPLPTVAPAISAPEVTLPDSSVVATGAIRSARGAAVGKLTIVATDAFGFVVRVSGPDVSHRSGLRVIASPTASDDIRCETETDSDFELGVSKATRDTDFVLSNPTTPFPRNDPSFFKRILFLSPATGTAACPSVIAAVSNLAWELPDMNAGLAVVDHGTRTGARGRLESDSNPTTYVAAAGDSWAKIAERLGITVGDLRWLNPLVSYANPSEDDFVNIDPGSR